MLYNALTLRLTLRFSTFKHLQAKRVRPALAGAPRLLTRLRKLLIINEHRYLGV